MSAAAFDDEPLTLFENVGEARARRPLSFSPYPITTRRIKARPTYFSRIPAGTDIGAAVKGSEFLRLPLLPQGEQVAALLESRNSYGEPLYPTAVILEPRRSTKTTSIMATILGRCYRDPGHKVVMTAQDGTRARGIFRNMQRALDAYGFEARGLGKLYWANGSERVEWHNGSSMWVVPPDAGAFRSEAADTMLFEEAGEYSLAESEDLLAGALPLLDTRPMGQVIITGTPSPMRAGLLWDTLEDARAQLRAKRRSPDVGILDYSVRDDEPTVLYPDGEDGEPVLNERLLRRVHPGIGTRAQVAAGEALTTMDKMRQRYAKMTLVKFEMEYLCRFPFDQSVSAINPQRWADARLERLPERPERVGLAFDVEPGATAAALVAAWRDERGHAHGELLAYRPGVTWLPAVAQAAAAKHRTAVAHDTIGANTNPADLMVRLRVRLAPLNLRAMQGAAQRLVTDLDEGRLHHYGQRDLDVAVEGANWRNVNDGGRLFGRKASANDVSPLVAFSAALWQYDLMGPREGAATTTVRRAAR